MYLCLYLRNQHGSSHPLGLLYRQESGVEKRHDKKVCMLCIYRFLNCVLTVTLLSI